MAEQEIKQEIMHQRTILAALSFPENLLFRNFPLFHISNFPVNRIGRRIPGRRRKNVPGGWRKFQRRFFIRRIFQPYPDRCIRVALRKNTSASVPVAI